MSIIIIIIIMKSIYAMRLAQYFKQHNHTTISKYIYDLCRLCYNVYVLQHREAPNRHKKKKQTEISTLTKIYLE